MTRLVSALALAAGLLFAATVPAADEKKEKDEKPAAKEGPKKPADWSGYATFGDVAGVVVSADEKGVTVQLTKTVPNLSRGGRGGGAKVEKSDLAFKYADNGLARWKKLPPKVGADGKKATYTSEELEKLKQPQGATGYAAERADLKPGHIVDLVLVRPKSVPASKATAEDLEIKYAVILGETTAPPQKKEK